MSDYTRFGVVLLAAGLSNRMGARNKLLLQVQGEALVRRAARLYCDLGMDVTIVVGHDRDLVVQELTDLPVQITVNEDYQQGQQVSVRRGLQASSVPEQGLLIALADQPFLMTTDISRFCDAFLASAMDKIWVPYHRAARGNPVLIPAGLVRRLQGVEDRMTVRAFIDSNIDLIYQYEAENTHFTVDIDTPDDLRRISSLLGSDGKTPSI